MELLQIIKDTSNAIFTQYQKIIKLTKICLLKRSNFDTNTFVFKMLFARRTNSGGYSPPRPFTHILRIWLKGILPQHWIRYSDVYRVCIPPADQASSAL